MQVNLRASAYTNGPLRSVNNNQFGFYEIGCLRQAIDHIGSTMFKVGAVNLPETEHEFRQIAEIINHPSIHYALVDKNKVVFVQIGDHGPDLEKYAPWLSIFNEMGYEVKGGGKTAKRLKSFHRPTLLNANFSLDQCAISLTADPAEFSRYEFDSQYTQEELERILDGGMIISHRLIKKAIKNIPDFSPNSTDDPNEYFFNPRVRQELINVLLHTKTFNIRLITPDGMLKGNGFVSHRLPKGIDVVSWSGNLKKEITYSKGMRFLAEPQSAKSRVHTDDQTMANFPMLFTKDDMESWLKEEYEKLFNSAVNDQALMNWKNIYQRSWRDKVNPEDEEFQARINYVGYRWRSMGMRVVDSPWLFETLTIGSAKPLESKIPIACAVYEQVVSESMVRMAGYTSYEVPQGYIRRHNEMELHVVNDLDWIEMYKSHGGCDQDDFFKLLYRTMEGGELDGHRVVIAMRSPNGFGEYSIFKYLEGEWYPTWKLSDGKEKSFLPVSGRGWPKRLSEAIVDGEVSYSGLPSQNNPMPKTVSESYSRQDVLNDLKASMSSGTVGKFVNSTMLWASVFGRHRLVQVCSLEDAIDGYVQTNVVEDRLAIDQDADVMVREVIDSRLPVDRSIWDAVNRNFSRYLKPGEWVEKYEGTITQMNMLCRKYFDEFCVRVRHYSQVDIKPLPLVQKLGYRMSFRARLDLKKFRQLIMNMNSQMTNDQGGRIDRDGWETIYKTIVDKINEFELDNDRYDYVLGLYLVSMTEPTSTGKVTDQIVMNRLVFGYLQRALQFYGIAQHNDVLQREDGTLDFRESRSTKWWYIDPETKVVTDQFDDPVEYQKFMMQRSNIVHSTAS
jgi:hypothetical protein